MERTGAAESRRQRRRRPSGPSSDWRFARGPERARRSKRPGRHPDRGSVFDGEGPPVADALVEIWQANRAGRYAHPEGSRGGLPGGGLRRLRPLPDRRRRAVRVRDRQAGARAGSRGRMQAPHIEVSIFARGLLKRLVTRIYFPDEARRTRPIRCCPHRPDPAERAARRGPRTAGAAVRHPSAGRRADRLLCRLAAHPAASSTGSSSRSHPRRPAIAPGCRRCSTSRRRWPPPRRWPGSSPTSRRLRSRPPRCRALRSGRARASRPRERQPGRPRWSLARGRAPRTRRRASAPGRDQPGRHGQARRCWSARAAAAIAELAGAAAACARLAESTGRPRWPAGRCCSRRCRPRSG